MVWLTNWATVCNVLGLDQVSVCYCPISLRMHSETPLIRSVHPLVNRPQVQMTGLMNQKYGVISFVCTEFYPVSVRSYVSCEYYCIINPSVNSSYCFWSPLQWLQLNPKMLWLFPLKRLLLNQTKQLSKTPSLTIRYTASVVITSLAVLTLYVILDQFN